VWDPKATAAAHEAQDKQFKVALEHLVQGLAHAFGSSLSGGPSSAGSGDYTQPPAPAASRAAPEAAAPEAPCSTEEQQEVLASMQRSVLLPFIAHEFAGKTIKELSDRHAYYSALLRVCQELCRPETEQLLAGHPLPIPLTSSSSSSSSSSSGLHLGHEHLTPLAALRGLRNGAQLFLKSLQSTNALSAPAGPSSSAFIKTPKTQEKADGGWTHVPPAPPPLPHDDCRVYLFCCSGMWPLMVSVLLCCE
jgi:hypothetical protein